MKLLIAISPFPGSNPDHPLTGMAQEVQIEVPDLELDEVEDATRDITRAFSSLVLWGVIQGYKLQVAP